ncbi:MAG: YgjV family protein [Arcobacter sp.]|uniref:YgjV family protein n=1 Tax=Arcobacter sp. TaxID=1872629 RepID=UPI003B00A86B
MFSFFVPLLGVLAIILNAIGMAIKDVIKTKVLLGTSVAFIIPDLYLSNGIHGVYQSIIVAIMYYIGALEYKRVEKVILYSIPFFSIFLLLGLKEYEGLFLVLASITTPLATISKDSFKMKLLLLISTFSWGTYAFLMEAWFAFAFDLLGAFALIYFFGQYRREKKARELLDKAYDEFEKVKEEILP